MSWSKNHGFLPLLLGFQGPFGADSPMTHPGVNASREIDCPPNSFNLDGDAANGCEVGRLGDPQWSPVIHDDWIWGYCKLETCKLWLWFKMFKLMVP